MNDQDRVDAERWRKLVARVQTKDLGTEFDEHGRPHSPTFRRFYLDTTNLNATTLTEAIDDPST